MPTGQADRLMPTLRRVVLARQSAARSDGDLLGAFVTARDAEAFAELVRRHGPSVPTSPSAAGGPNRGAAGAPVGGLVAVSSRSLAADECGSRAAVAVRIGSIGLDTGGSNRRCRR